MSNIAKALTLALALPLAQAAAAQTTTAPAADAATTAPAATSADATKGNDAKAADTKGSEADTNADAFPTGKDVVGSTYDKATFDDWKQRCTHADDGHDLCEASQLVLDDQKNPVAEFNIIPLTGNGQAVAGANVLTPLETLLSAGVTLQVDGSPAHRYPFSWCDQVGCIARLGFTADDLSTLKKGATATLTIVPVRAQNHPISLNISLKGFTAAYTAVEKNNAEVNKQRAAEADTKKKN